jgi:hypothetical protein
MSLPALKDGHECCELSMSFYASVWGLEEGITSKPTTEPLWV